MKISFTTPMESLAAFAIAFGAGVASTLAVNVYVAWIERKNGWR